MKRAAARFKIPRTVVIGLVFFATVAALLTLAASAKRSHSVVPLSVSGVDTAAIFDATLSDNTAASNVAAGTNINHTATINTADKRSPLAPLADNNLAPGELAIVSYQSDFDASNPLVGDNDLAEFEDRFSLVVLKPAGLQAGTVVFFTTRGWNAVSANWHDVDYPPFTFGLGRRAVVQWTVPAAGIARGTEVFFINKYHDEVAVGSEFYDWGAYSDYAGTVPLGVMANVTPIVPAANSTDGMGFTFAGDHLLVYQTGPAAGPTGGFNGTPIRFITALMANNNGTTTYANWDPAPGPVNSESSVPPGLVNGQTAFLMSPGPLPAASNGTNEPDNGKFSNCSLSAAGTTTAAQMSALIYTIGNWTYNNSVFPLGTASSFCTYNLIQQDLTASKTNNVSNAAVVGQTWTWTITLTNSGSGAAIFPTSTKILADNLPNSANISYGTPTPSIGGVNCSINGTKDLTCTATSQITLAAGGGSFNVQFTAVATAPATYTNPRGGGGVCSVDPDLAINETDEGNNGCTNAVTVGKANTTTTVASSQNPSVTGQAVTFTATINVTAPGAGTPTGSVDFLDGASLICNDVPVSASIQCTTSTLSAGTRTINAQYNSDGNFNVGTGTLGGGQVVSNTATWDGSTSSDWNDPTNWTTNFAPGITNFFVNDVVIPNVGNQPTIGTTDISIFSLNLANGRTLTITATPTLQFNGAGGNLTLNGIISGGKVDIGNGTHTITNAGGTGSLSSTNLTTLSFGAVVTLNNSLQMGALAINSGASLDISNRTLSLNAPGAALVVGGGPVTTTGSTVVFNGTAAQQAAGIAYNNLTINNTIGTNVVGVTLTGSATVNGVLALTASDLNMSTFTLTQPNTTASTGTGDVIGNVTRTSGSPFALAAPLTFGNPNNVLTFTAGATRPTSVSMNMIKAPPSSYLAAVQRNYQITTNGGAFTATLRLHYIDSELNSNVEAGLNLRRQRTSDSHWVSVLPTTLDSSANWVESNAVSNTFLPAEFTFSSFSPTASGGTVTGRIVDDHGLPVEGAVVRLEGTQNRKFITDANGSYRFENVPTSGFYTLTPSRVNYSFNPSMRSFSQLGESTEAAFGATLAASNYQNPLDTPEYFVRQHYLDFLGREPDEAGFNFWSDQILSCGGDAVCISRRRENGSAAFFLSIEFQKTGGLIAGLYRASYGTNPQYSSFMPDTRMVGNGVRVGSDGWEALLRANTEAFVNSFVNRAAFHQMYDGMADSLFVDTLIGHTGVSFTSAERDTLVSGLGTGQMTRAQALQSIAENNSFVQAKFNETFVMMEYYGYLRRDYDSSGFMFWLNKLNEFNGNFEQAEMVKAFIISGEYRDRFPR